MGTLIRIWKTMPIPSGATIGNKGQVRWVVRGKKRTGKLSGADRVAVQVNTWTAQFVDETGEVRRVSTKTAVRSVAEKILAQYEKEVERIKSGVITRAELDKAQIKQMPLMEMMEQFRSKMIAEGTAGKHASNSLRRINKVFQQCTDRLAH